MNIHKNSFLIVILIAMTSLNSCKVPKSADDTAQNKTSADQVITIVTEAMDFQTADTIRSGWNTFRYINKSHETHFFLMDRYPEGKTLKQGNPEVIQVFQKGMDLLNEGKTQEGYDAFNALPEWFFQVVFTGGSGLLSAGETSETTIYLEPGYYVMECYVKMGSGMFHSAMGMVEEVIVLEEKTSLKPPEADIKISISSADGITFDTPVTKGNKTFSVLFKDQITHENFVGHDVNLARLHEEANLEALEKWMNWADPKGLITPAPKGVTFLGGVNEMPAGQTGYFTATLEPGTYALISEVPNSMKKNMLKTFEVH